MTPRFSAPMRLAAVGAATVVVGVVASSPALASGNGDVKVTNTETVQIYTSPTGEIQTKRVYEQLALVGQGKVDISNPVSTDGLRNLDGFGGFTVKGGNQILDTTVNGEKRLRSVSNYDSKPPLDVSVAYKLDGRNVKPGDVVGKSGHLEVRYTVKNVTGVPQQLTFDDGHGGTVTKTVDVPIPMVGSLDVTAPSSFTHVTSEAANMAGDGKGGTKMSFTMTLFPPIGSDTAVFGYDADITDGVIPRAEISALPVNPLQSPTFKSAAGSYQGGADSGIQLSTGATTIDENLLKLRDGAAQLLGGLLQLRDGAQQLQAGLAGQAVPGAGRLATGAGQLDDGLGLLNAGSKRLAAGTGEALAGSGKLASGAGKLADGLQQASSKAPALIGGLGQVRDGLLAVKAGLGQMYDKVGTLPAQAQPLFDGIDAMLAGIGDKATQNTLLYGVDQVRLGLNAALPKIQMMADGVYKNDPAAPGAYQKLSCAKTVLDAVKSGTLGGGALIAGTRNPCFVSAGNPTGTVPPLDALTTVNLTDGVTNDEYRTIAVTNVISGIADGLPALATPDGAVDQTTLYGGLMTLKEGLQHFPTSGSDTPGAIVALAAIECGLDTTAVDGVTLPNGMNASVVCARYPTGPLAGQVKPGLVQGLAMVSGGVNQLVTQVVSQIQTGIGQQDAKYDPANPTLVGGVNGLLGGVDLLSTKGGTLIDGLGLLADGGTQLSNGADRLNAGLGTLDAGAGKLSGGLGDAKDGSGQLSAGAQKLAVGLGDAANGSGKLAAGLGTAAKGAPKLVNGAQKLSTQGTKKLVAAGEDTAQNYGEQYAVFKAGAERASTSSMAFGAPAGAIGLTAYSYVIQGDDGESGRNWTRGAGGLALLGAGGVLFALRRRFI